MSSSRLFGHPVSRDSNGRLVDRIHDILREEIHAGRWKIGEKLPSMMMIADQCQISRMPVQQAIEQLGAEGYVRQANRSGIYLKSMAPRGNPLGVIGMLLHSNPKNQREIEHIEHEHMLVNRFTKMAASRNYQTRVLYLPQDMEWSDVNRAGAVFDDDVKGIVSLVPFSRTEVGSMNADRIPLVFWCEPDHRCAPCVASDYEMAFYLLTSELIKKGHRRIAVLATPMYTEELNRMHYRGYRRAMNENGLQIKQDYFDESLHIDYRDVAGCKQFLQEKNEVTAYVCITFERGDQVIQSLHGMGIQVPEDVSVVCSNPYIEEKSAGLQMSGVGFSPEKEMQMCFDMLRQQRIHREWTIGTVLVAPSLIAGETIAEPLAGG
jgi:DNA-binding LacI/PurR family transcriptional regulator